LDQWKYRDLTINGKMLIIKTFAMSQLVYVSQFMNIRQSDVKRIEKICYSFLWGHKPERVRRNILKCSKLDGGINGVDVDCFLRAIKVKQYIKGLLAGSYIRAISFCCKNLSEINIMARNSLYKLWKQHTFDLSDSDYERLATGNLSIMLRPNSKAESVAVSNNIHSISMLAMNLISRGKTNQIIKGLPLCVRPCLLANPLDEPNNDLYQIVVSGTIRDVKDLNSSALQAELKKTLNKVTTPCIGTNYGTFPDNVMEKQTFKCIWGLGFPKAIGYRLKIVYKDVFYNHRRYRAGLTDSPNCAICGSVESLEHMLFDCVNAKKLWQFYSQVTGVDTPDCLYDAICFTEDYACEVVKTIVFKRLVAIDRSCFLSFDSFLNEVVRWAIIERNSKYEPLIAAMLARNSYDVH